MILLRKTKENSIKASFKLSTIFIVLFTFFGSINGNAETGEKIFTSNCNMCHTIGGGKLVGPDLKDVLTHDRFKDESDPLQAMIKFVQNPAEFNVNTMMPQDYTDDEIKSVLEYIKANETSSIAAVGEKEEVEENYLKKIFMYSGIILLIALIYYSFKIKWDYKRSLQLKGIFSKPHEINNYAKTFFYFITISAIIIYLLIKWLSNDPDVETADTMKNTLMFIVLPYAAFAIFIIGSIYRYTNKGFKVSSLSSQFIEGRKLFWGSQPFHWGILILFLGHLIAFLFPSAILAWNGQPLRLLILEITSFAFGLSALLGIILLIKRRLSTKTLLVVTNKMDILVYTTLLIQIISGLGVAFFVRWGSSWFSSVLTPYLRSIFSFNPDINAVAEMPAWIQIHIISAFFIIAIIPFSRFMHFLVAPIDYIWRKYQVVIWNWDKSAIRKSTKHTFGKESRNH